MKALIKWLVAGGFLLALVGYLLSDVQLIDETSPLTGEGDSVDSAAVVRVEDGLAPAASVSSSPRFSSHPETDDRSRVNGVSRDANFAIQVFKRRWRDIYRLFTPRQTARSLSRWRRNELLCQRIGIGSALSIIVCLIWALSWFLSRLETGIR